MEFQTYAGDVTPTETWAQLRDQPKAVLIDVRTQPEWAFVGIPDLEPLGKKPICVQWQIFPTMTVNNDFAAQLQAEGLNKDIPCYFLCRSGVRSKAAAQLMTGLGWSRCFNISDGFEGPLDPAKHRGVVAGWKALDLPWKQG